MDGNLSILLTTEGTYPFHQGGVSTWCDSLIKNSKNVKFTVYSVIMNPFVTQKFTLPDNTKLIQVPLWGTEEPSEHLGMPFSKMFLQKKITTDDVIDKKFIGYFKELIIEIMSIRKEPEKFEDLIVHLYKYFREYEYKVSFKSERTWGKFKEIIEKYSKDDKYGIINPDVYGLINSLGWIYRFLNVINTPIPETNICHSSAAAFCGIPCVISKKIYKSSYLLTEHGVYLREQYLSLSKRQYPSYLNTFLIRLIKSVVKLNYYSANQISPVCEYNTKWEREFGVNKEKIRVIYNGIDDKVFVPVHDSNKDHTINVVMVARIDPIKDIISFIKAAAIIYEKYKNVKFYVYGSVSVKEYFNECKIIKSKLKLDQVFIFAGHTSDVTFAYKLADIVVLSSISEAFPYSVIEAMMMGKAIVATDVGGVKEAMVDTGIIVPPRDEKELARGINIFMENKMLRYDMGESARNRALTHFTLEKIMFQYLKNYINLVAGQKIQVVEKKFNPYLTLKKAYAFLYAGLIQEALIQFKYAINNSNGELWAKVIDIEIEKIYKAISKK